MNKSCKFKYVRDYLEYHALVTPDAAAVKDGNGCLSYQELNSQADSFAAALIRTGIAQGDRIVIYSENRIEFIVAIFGCLKANAVFIPLHSSSPEARLPYIVRNSKSKAVITSDPAKAAGLESSLTVISFDLSINDEDESSKVLFFLDMIREENTGLHVQANRVESQEDIAAIIYTSGSTGYPKGVVEPNQAIVFVTDAINKIIGNTQSDRILCGLPLSFDYGLYQVFLTFSVGALLVLTNELNNPLAIPRLLVKEKITGFPIMPSVAGALLRSRLLERVTLPDLTYITSTGDIFHREHISNLLQLLPRVRIFSMYGLTECKRVSILAPQDYIGHEDSVGKALPGTQVYVADQDGNRLKAGERGQLIVSGPHLMSGYWNDEEETKRRFAIDPANGIRFLYTNDIFRIDEEGFLFYEGRDETLIKSSGYRLSVSEVERIMMQLTGVEEACAAGTEDMERGQAVIVYLSVNPESFRSSEKDVRQIFNKHFGDNILLKKVHITSDPLPRTANGKWNRKSLAAQ